jgi:hypothetical protein
MPRSRLDLPACDSTQPACSPRRARHHPGDGLRARVFALNDRMSINDQSMDHMRVDQIVRKGDTEIWEIP